MADRPVDVLIAGGGIVGAGIARDAAMRGLRVALVEQHDLAFGTSSRSSRLLHGGIRYLAQGRIGLVYEASREKRVIHTIAPHLSDPLAFIFPTYSGTQWPRWQLRVGVILYDLLCGGRNLGPSSGLGPSGMLKLLPSLNANRLTGGVRYYDGLTNDARLAIDTLRSAAKHGAIIGNYLRLEEAQPGREGWACRVRDLQAGREFSVVARSVVNATGPWADKFPQSTIRLRLTKGIHMVIDRRRLPVPDAVVVTEGSRILFVIPWGERVILGTTDTDYNDLPEKVVTEPSDVQYVLQTMNGAFPGVNLTTGDILSAWAGLRPLIADSRGRPSDISRRHEIRMSQPGWLDVAGGKLTTYRLIAEQAVDRLVRHLKCPASPCRTAAEPLLSPDEVQGISGIVPPPVGPDVVRHACQQEWALHLDDVMLRRTGWHYYHADAADIAQKTAAWMAEVQGWDATRQEAELTRYRDATAFAKE
jgi:glycerol-3-phosphate dehydrogenase